MEKLKQNPIVKKLGLNRIMLVCILVLMFVVFKVVLGSKFPVGDSIKSTLNYVYFLGFLSLGVTFVIATGGIDFSIGPVMFCCALVSGYCMTSYGVPCAAAMVLCVLIGLAFGIFNGWLVSYMSVPPFIVSMASMNIAKGIASVFTKTQSVSWPQSSDPVNGWFRNIASYNGFPVGLVIFLGMAVVCGIVLYNTKPGRYILCLGSNSEAVRLSGVNTRKWRMLAYVICGFLVGIGALFFVATYTTVQPGYGDQYNNEAIAGCVMGGTSMVGGLASIGGTVIGVFIISLLQQGIMAFGLGKGQQMKDIDKSFPGVHALDHVNFEVKRGEVHALMGENGAGKSTLMKVLTGIYQKDSGTITYKGKETEFHNTREAQDAGVVIVHQELNMIGDLTVAQNIFIGREPKKGIRVDDKKMIEDSRKLFQDLNIEIDPREKMSNLTVGKQQMCEIAKAISHKAEVIIFDEPSAALTEKEIADLFEIIKDLRKKNLGIVYISHRMDEIKVITDRVTVMRDGGYVGTLITADSTKEDIINMMVGRVIYEDPKDHSMVAPDAPVVLKVEHLNAGKMVQDVSFELRKGEILGFSGLMGAGRTETARALFGADPKQSGKISIMGKDGQLHEVTINSPQDAVKYGIGYLSEDRRRYGVVVQKSVTENTTLATMEEYCNGLFINKAKEKKVTERYVKELATKTPSTDQLVVNLSGGNQQKVVIAKWLTRDSEILIFDEPTRGIDVGAKNEIYKLMSKLAAEGKSIIMISSEMTEILRMSDRIIVMCEGKVTGNIDISEATQEHIMNKATRNID